MNLRRENFEPPSGQITKLDLSGKNLKEIPRWVFEIRTLQELDLSNNELKTLPNSFDNNNIKFISKLNLSNNKLSSLPDSFKKLQLLRVLDISGNQFTKVPNEVLALKQHLYILKMRDNPFGSIRTFVKLKPLLEYSKTKTQTLKNKNGKDVVVKGLVIYITTTREIINEFKDLVNYMGIAEDKIKEGDVQRITFGLLKVIETYVKDKGVVFNQLERKHNIPNGPKNLIGNYLGGKKTRRRRKTKQKKMRRIMKKTKTLKQKRS